MRARHRLAEFGNIRACEEGAAVAAHDDGLHAIVGERGLQLAVEADAHGGTQRVDRRVVRDDHGDVAVAFAADGVGHLLGLQWKPFALSLSKGFDRLSPNGLGRFTL